MVLKFLSCKWAVATDEKNKQTGRWATLALLAHDLRISEPSAEKELELQFSVKCRNPSQNFLTSGLQLFLKNYTDGANFYLGASILHL